MSRLIISLIFILSCALKVVIAFNIDTKYASIFQDPSGGQSYFGYSVALRRAAPGTNWDSWLLVGAPRANSSLPQHASLHQPGVVFECRLKDGQGVSGEQLCSPLLLDAKGNEKQYVANGLSYHHLKDNSWIGGSLDVEDEENGRVVTCGPRWINQFYEETYLMNGICYWYDKGSFMTKEAQLLLPLVEKKKQVYTMRSEKPGEPDTKVFFYAFGGAGISAQFVQSRNKSELLIGAPGVFDWKGTTIRYRDTSLAGFGEETFYNELNIANPGYTSAIQYFEYFGFSVGAGKFFPGNGNTYYVAGAPRAADYRGKVILYSMPNSPDGEPGVLRELIGQQMGEYFGASVCVVDLTGDGEPDLVVGAPGHSLPSLNTLQPQGDEGRIYVFINELRSPAVGSLREMGENNKIMGTQQYGARFGTTIVNVGDLNLDGHEDIAVGAPYEDGGRGAVYIYHGKKSGINQKFAQRISARELNPYIRGFGISISRGVDIDKNSYKDLAVGAYSSGHAIIFRSRPVISFQGHIKTNAERISFNASGFSASACIFYTGKKAPTYINAVVTIQVDPVYKRAHIYSAQLGKASSMSFDTRLKLDTPVCKNFTIEIKSQNQDFSKPIDLQMTADIDESSNTRIRRQAEDEFCKNCPVVDPNGLSTISARVPYSTGCKQDDVCKTDLIVTTKIMDVKPPIVIGSVNKLEVKITVRNEGEPAFLSQVQISLPKGAPLLRVPQTCGEIATEDGPINLKCDIGNPLPANGQVEIPIELDLKPLPAGTGSLDIRIKATSVGEEQNDKNNAKNLTLALQTSADITITGKSVKSHFPVDWHNKSRKAEILTFSHVYEVINYGPSPVEHSRVVITLPYMLTESNSFIKIYKPQASLDGKVVTCSVNGGNYYTDKEVDKGGAKDSEILTESSSSEYRRRSKRNTKELVYDGQLPVNRTLFVNCSQPNVECLVVECHVGPLTSSQNIATITFQMKADLQQIEKLIEEKDIVLLASRGTVDILSLPSSVQPEGDRPDEAIIHTMFYGKIPEGGIPTWWIALAIILGILILLLIILALVKMGFFKRDKKTELEALRHKTMMEDEFGDE